jgi:hypothetical protein
MSRINNANNSGDKCPLWGIPEGTGILFDRKPLIFTCWNLFPK